MAAKKQVIYFMWQCVTFEVAQGCGWRPPQLQRGVFTVPHSPLEVLLGHRLAGLSRGLEEYESNQFLLLAQFTSRKGTNYSVCGIGSHFYSFAYTEISGGIANPCRKEQFL